MLFKHERRQKRVAARAVDRLHQIEDQGWVQRLDPGRKRHQVKGHRKCLNPITKLPQRLSYALSLHEHIGFIRRGRIHDVLKKHESSFGDRRILQGSPYWLLLRIIGYTQRALPDGSLARQIRIAVSHSAIGESILERLILIDVGPFGGGRDARDGCVHYPLN